MDYKLAFAYVFQDPDWVKKILIGFALALFFWLIIPALCIAGYYVKTIRNFASGTERPLPEWDDWGSLLISGLKLTATFFIYGIATVMIVGIVILPFMLSLDESANEPLSIVFFILFEIFIIMINIVTQALMPAITIQFARNEAIADAFKFGDIVALIKSNPLEYLLVTLLGIAAGWIGSLGFIFLIIGVVVTILYSELVKASLYGQYLRSYSQKSIEG